MCAYGVNRRLQRAAVLRAAVAAARLRPRPHRAPIGPRAALNRSIRTSIHTFVRTSDHTGGALKVPALHCADAWAVLLRHGHGWSVCYSGDTRPSDAIAAAARGDDPMPTPAAPVSQAARSLDAHAVY